MLQSALTRGLTGLALTAALLLAAPVNAAGSYDDLVGLFREWQACESGLRDGAPDYTAPTLARKHGGLRDYQSRLAALDPPRGRGNNASITNSCARR